MTKRDYSGLDSVHEPDVPCHPFDSFPHPKMRRLALHTTQTMFRKGHISNNAPLLEIYMAIPQNQLALQMTKVVTKVDGVVVVFVVLLVA